MTRLKLRKTGNSLSSIWPKETLARMNVGEGDELFVIQTTNGVLVTPFDPDFEKTIETARKVMARDRNALKELAG